MADGRDYFKASIDTAQFMRDADKMKSKFSEISNTAASEGSKMDDTFKKIGAGIAGYFTIQAAGSFVKELVNVRGEFQQLEIAFTTMLKSKERSTKLMAEITQFAATTPFDLKQVAAGTKQLLAYGFAAEDMQKNLSMLGNVASGVGSQIGDLIYLYGTLKASGRVTQMDMNQFAGRGIPIYAELAKVMGIAKDEVRNYVSAGKVGFPEIEKAFQGMTNESGMFYNLMQEQSKSLTGQISNLGDAFDSMFNEIGKGTEGVLSSGIQGVAFLVENYEAVGKVIGSLVAVYGAYKAAVITMNVVTAYQQGLTAKSIILNYSKIASEGAAVVAENLLTAAIAKQTAAQALSNKVTLANPYVLAAMAVTTLVIAMNAYANSASKAITKAEILNDLEKDSAKNTKIQSGEIESLKKILNDSNKSYAERNVALGKLQTIVPTYHASLTTEGKLINNNADALDTYVRKLVVVEKMKLAATKQASADEAADKYKNDNSDVLKTAIRKNYNGEPMFAGEKAALETWRQLSIAANNYGDTIQSLQEELVSIDAKTIGEEKKETKEEKSARLAKEKQDRKDAENAIKQFNKDKLKNIDDANRAEADLMRSGITDKKELLDFDYVQTVEAIQAQMELFKKENPNYKKSDLLPFYRQVNSAVGANTQGKSLIDKEQLEKAQLEFETFLQKRNRIIKEYNDKISIVGVDSEAGKQGATLRDEALAALDMEMALKEETFKVLLDKIQKTGLEELKKQLEKASSTIPSSTNTPEQNAALRAEIEALKKQIEVLQASKDTSPEKKWGDTLKVMNEVNDATKNIINSFEGLDDATKSALTAAANISGAVIAGITGIVSLSAVGVAAIKGVERASVILGIIGAAISIVTTIINLFDAAKKKRQEALKETIAQQQKEFLGLIEYNSELRKKYEWTKKIGETELDFIYRKNAELLKQKTASEKEQKDLESKLSGATYKDGKKIDIVSGFGGFKKFVEVDNWVSLAGKTFKDISELSAKGLLSEDGEKYYQALKKAKEEGQDIEKMQLEHLQHLKELATGTTSQTITDQIIQGFKDGKRSAADFADTFEELMSGAVQSALSQMTDKGVNDWYEEFFTASKDGLTPEEQAALKKSWDKLISDTEQAKKDIELTTGISIGTDSARSAQAKGIQSISQDSANKLDGTFTAISGHTYSIMSDMKMLTSNASNVLNTLMGIKSDTSNLARLEGIEKSMEGVNAKLGIINDKGISVKSW